MPVDQTKAIEQWERYRYCRDQGHLDFVKKADKCDDFFVGLQWDEADLARLRSQKRPAMTINKIISTLGTMMGEQIQNRSEILFRPKNGSPVDIAEALTKVWMHVAQENQLPWVRSDVFCDGLIRSRGFYDMRMKFGDSMKGEIAIDLENSKNVVIDPDADEYDPDNWNDVFSTKWMTGADVAILYNETDAEALGTMEESQFLYGFDSIDQRKDRFGGDMLKAGFWQGSTDMQVQRNIRVIDRQFRMLDKQLHFVDVETGDMRPVPPHWDKERIGLLLSKAAGRINTTKKLVKRIRWRVTADTIVLHDEWSPYKHFTKVPYFPYFRYGNTVGVVENLLGPQEILNKASSQELHIINTTANSGWKVEAGSLVNMSIEELEQKGAQTGLVIEYVKNAQPPEKILPNATPTGLDRISYKAEEHIKTISNVSDSQQGFDREDVAAKAIAYKRQASSANMSKVIDNLERTDFILARNGTDLIQQYYTEERIINITHADVLREPEEMTVNQVDPATGVITNDLTIGEYDITVSSSPYRANLEDAQFDQAMGMREAGIAIPDEFVIENSRLLRRAELVKTMREQKAGAEAQAQADRQKRAEEAEIAETEAGAALKGAQAQKAGAEAQTDTGQTDLMKMQAELQLERERMDMELAKMREELAMKQQEMDMKLEIKAREHQQDSAIKAQEAEQSAQIREEDAVANRANQLRQSQQDDSSTPRE
jgi:hypothetical protein